MEPILITDTSSLSRGEWLAYRLKGIGGSDAAAVAGISKYATPYTLWLDKTGRLADDEAGEAAYWGTKLEDKVLDEIATRLPDLIGISNVRPANQMFRHGNSDLFFMLANPDGFADHPEWGPGIVECKTAGHYVANQWDHDSIPDAYQLQAQHYMEVCDRDWTVFGVLIAGQRFEWRFLRRDPDLLKDLVKLETEFWLDHVIADVPPALTGLAPDSEALKAMHSESSDMAVLLSDEQAGWVDEIIRLKTLAKNITNDADALVNKLKAHMGDASIAVDTENVVRATWNTNTTHRLDQKRLRADHPDLFDEYYKPQKQRRFLTKGPK